MPVVLLSGRLSVRKDMSSNATPRKPRRKKSDAAETFSQELFPIALPAPEAAPPPQAAASLFRTRFDLRLGDCLDGMKALPAESVDVVVTSPPYNLDIA